MFAYTLLTVIILFLIIAMLLIIPRYLTRLLFCTIVWNVDGKRYYEYGPILIKPKSDRNRYDKYINYW